MNDLDAAIAVITQRDRMNRYADGQASRRRRPATHVGHPRLRRRA